MCDINFFLPQIHTNLGILCFCENKLPRNEFISRISESCERSRFKKYKFAQENIETIASLNTKIRKAELRIRAQLFTLRAQLDDMVRRNLIDNFFIRFKISVFSNHEATNQKYKVEEGDPIYESRVLIEGYFEWDNMFFENWNHYQFDKSHPLSSLNFCYTMHAFVFHSHHLDWEDIFAISEIWLEMKVDYLFSLDKDL